MVNHTQREWPLCGPFCPSFKTQDEHGGVGGGRQSLNKVENKTSKISLLTEACALQQQAWKVKLSTKSKTKTKPRPTNKWKKPIHNAAPFTLRYLRIKINLITFANPMPRAHCPAYIWCPIIWGFLVCEKYKENIFMNKFRWESYLHPKDGNMDIK